MVTRLIIWDVFMKYKCRNEVTVSSQMKTLNLRKGQRTKQRNRILVDLISKIWDSKNWKTKTDRTVNPKVQSNRTVSRHKAWKFDHFSSVNYFLQENASTDIKWYQKFTCLVIAYSLSMIYNNYKQFRCNLGEGRVGTGKMTENLFFYKTA